MIRDRLRQFADDCEERARGTRHGHARNLYHHSATTARLAANRRGAGDDCLGRTLQAMKAQAMLAQWYDGSEPDATPDILSGGFAPALSVSAGDRIRLANIDLTNPPEKHLAACPPDALDVAELAHLFAMSKRGAREAIRRNAEAGRSGFYRDGWRWFADREAFARARRRSAEFVPFARGVALQGHDSADHP